jgi:hypothetical protein
MDQKNKKWLSDEDGETNGKQAAILKLDDQVTCEQHLTLHHRHQYHHHHHQRHALLPQMDVRLVAGLIRENSCLIIICC